MHVGKGANVPNNPSPAQDTSGKELDGRMDSSVPVEQDIQPDPIAQDSLEEADLEKQATELEDLAVEFLKK